MPGPRRRRRRGTLAGALAAALLLGTLGAVPAEADNSAIGYPVYSGSADPVPELPAGFTVRRTMRAQYDADRRAGNGTDFWMDRMLARKGDDPSGDWLFTRGRAVFMKEHEPGWLGFAGQVAYGESIDNRSAYTVDLVVDGERLTLREDVDARVQTPSHWRGEFTHEATGLKVVQTKFITDANVAVTRLALTHTGSGGREITLRASSPYTGTPEGRELTGTVPAKNNLTTVFPRLSGDGFTPDGDTLTRTVTVPAARTLTTKVQLGFVTEEITASRPAYDAVRTASPGAAFRTHVQTYNRWWAENLPFMDLPDDNIEKTLYYRWWLLRFNYLDADIPGNDYQFPTSMEGVLGYNNAIALTVGMFVDDPEVPAGSELRVRPLGVRGRGVEEREVHRQPRRPGELVQQLHPVHLRGRLALLPGARRSRRHPAQPRPVRGEGRRGPARGLRPRRQRADRVRLGRDDRQRRRRGVVRLEAGQPGPRRVGVRLQQRHGGGPRVRRPG
nr:hypothetical protein [Streptomyces caniscabiei]